MSVYLYYGVVVACLAIVLLIVCRRHRRLAFVSGALAAPFGLLDAFFVEDYWSPSHLIGPHISIEGIFFSFGNGVFVWLIAIYPFRRRVSSRLRLGTLLPRYALVSATGLFAMFFLWRDGLGASGLDLMTSAQAAMLLAGLVVLWQRPDLLPIAVSGSLGFAAFYVLQLAALSIVGPDLSTAWHPVVRDGFTVFGYPIEEVVWALAYGAVAPLAMAFAGNVEIGKKDGDVDVGRTHPVR